MKEITSLQRQTCQFVISRYFELLGIDSWTKVEHNAANEVEPSKSVCPPPLNLEEENVHYDRDEPAKIWMDKQRNRKGAHSNVLVNCWISVQSRWSAPLLTVDCWREGSNFFPLSRTWAYVVPLQCNHSGGVFKWKKYSPSSSERQASIAYHNLLRHKNFNIRFLII